MSEDMKAPEPRHLLAAIVRQIGRARVSPKELDDVRTGQLGLRVDDAGCIIIEWREVPR